MAGDGERLTLDGADGTHVILLDGDGRRFRLEVDDELRDAVRRSRRSRPTSSTAGPEEASMDTSPTDLRPRDIQARVRAGATAEEIAELTGTTVDKVLVYARPVLAERAHMAQRAQRSSVRRTGGDTGGGGHRTLGDAVAKRLRAIDEDPTTVEWDSRKREDGRWVLTASYTTAEVNGLARFTFDPPGNFVTADDGDARWLLGDDEPPAAPATPGVITAETDAEVADVDEEPSGPRLVAVADGELPLGGDALHLVGEPGEPYSTYTLDDIPGADDTDTTDGAGVSATDATAEQDAVDDGDPDPDPDGDQPTRRRTRKRGGRASVPSWDEIMFGGRRE